MNSPAATADETHLPRQQKIGTGELLLLLCSVLSLVASCFLWSARKQAWMDEIFTWKEVSDRSLWHLYWAIQHGADGGQPLFYTTAWLWAKAFGTSFLSLRLFSCAAMCGALLITWRTIRSAYGLWATAFGVLCVWCTSGLVLDQNAEARFYGLYVLTVAVTINIYARLAAQKSPSPRLLVCAFLSQAALVLTHVLGILYGGVILLALIIFDQRRRWFRPKTYFAYASGWLALLFWIPAMRASMVAGKPHGWIVPPQAREVIQSNGLELGWAFLIAMRQHWPAVFPPAIYHLPPLLVVVALVVVALRWRARSGAEATSASIAHRRGALFLVALAILTVPLWLFVLSHLVTPVFTSRYIVPSAAGLAIILAAFAHTIGIDKQLRSGMLRLARPIVVVMLLAFSLWAATVPHDFATESYLDVRRVESDIPPNAMVVVGWVGDFTKMMRFAPNPPNYFFLLDWTTALKGPRDFVLDYHLMRAYRDAGYYAQNIQTQNVFFCAHPDFYVLDDTSESWFDVTVRRMPEFEWRQVDALDTPERKLFAVHRSAPLPFCN